MGDNKAATVACSDDQFFNPVLTMGYQVAAILVLSHACQLGLKFIPGPIAQILVSTSSKLNNMLHAHIHPYTTYINCQNLNLHTQVTDRNMFFIMSAMPLPGLLWLLLLFLRLHA